MPQLHVLKGQVRPRRQADPGEPIVPSESIRHVPHASGQLAPESNVVPVLASFNVEQL